ncbi:MAG: penicillin-binding transpeptidase domain-containing protein [Kofleriaceae bacterium]
MTIETILFAALRGALVLGLALAAMPLLRRASAATRRLVLVSAFAVVVILPIATAVLPSLYLRGAPAPVDTSEVVVAVPEAIVEVAATMVLAPASAPPAPRVATTPSWAPSPFEIVGALWALGAITVLARLAIGLLRAHRIAKNARLLEVRRIDAARIDTNGARIDPTRIDANGARGARTVEIRSTAALDTPAVTGVFRPVILLPREADAWTDERRELVIAHELAHVARRDCLASVIAQLAVAMHWFDPLAWLCVRRLRIERELAADDHVLDRGATASSYAEHLLALAHVPAYERAVTGHARTAVPAGALAMAEPSQVSVRIRALLAPSHSRAPMGRVRTALFAISSAAVAMIVACASPDREPPAIPDAGARRAPITTTATTGTTATTTATTIDPAIQTIVDEEIDRLELDWGPCVAMILVLDPANGHVLAASHRGGTEATAQLAAVRPMFPGSTIKPLVIAAALEEGAITTTEQFDASPMSASIRTPAIIDASPNGTLDARGILTVSSNVGMVRVFDKLGGAKTAAWLARLGFAKAPSTITDDNRGAAFAIGASMTATPLEVAGAYGMLANGGTYHAPTFVPQKDQAPRVLSEQTAKTVLEMLESVTTSERGTGKAARVEGVRVGGKTGTAHLGKDNGWSSTDYYASFVGTAPLDQPRYVVFVGAETPRDGSTGGKVAAPAFSRIMGRLLAR